MASIKTNTTLQNSVNWAAAYLVQRPSIGVGGTLNEPAITVYNIITGIILGAPMKWEWNRIYSAAAITTVAGTSDYAVELDSFGYLEAASLILTGGNSNPNSPVQTAEQAWELELYKELSREPKQDRPLKIATLLDNNEGTITFRLFPTPDQEYDVDLIYQMAPNYVQQGSVLPLVTWAPIPDKMAYIYHRGFLAYLQGMYNTQLYLNGMEMFYRQLVAAAEGLTEQEKAIYLTDQLRALQTQQAATLVIQQGKQARL